MGDRDIEVESEDTSEARGPGNESTQFQDPLAPIAASSVAMPSLLPTGADVGEYRVVKQLGRGAFGAVYHATHTVIGKQVALKVLNASFSEDAAMAARFIDEARAVNRIAHPNIVDIFGFGVLPDGRKYCVMELLRGETLGDRVEKSGPLEPALALDVLSQIASALDAAHGSGIVHRDLKPENVFLCEPVPGESRATKVKLLDFGIAQIADGLHQRTGSNMVLGTPAYMSPEQCRGARIDYRSDIYSLGVVAFELLTGKQPFHGENAFQLTAQHLTAEPPAPSKLVPALSPAVDQAVLVMLAKPPGARPATASAAIRALGDAWQLGEGAAARSLSTSRGKRAGVGAKTRWLLGAALVLTLLALIVGARSFLGREQHRPGAASATVTAPPAVAVTTIAPEPTSARPVAAAIPSVVNARIEGEPAGAKVLLGGREVATLGQSFELPRSSEPVRLRVRAAGYVEREVSVIPDHDHTLQVKLPPKARKSAPRANGELEY